MPAAKLQDSTALLALFDCLKQQVRVFGRRVNAGPAMRFNAAAAIRDEDTTPVKCNVDDVVHPNNLVFHVHPFAWGQIGSFLIEGKRKITGAEKLKGVLS